MDELELFGAELLNQELAALLGRQGFTPATDQIPEALGGGEMTILFRVFPVAPAGGG